MPFNFELCSKIVIKVLPTLYLADYKVYYNHHSNKNLLMPTHCCYMKIFERKTWFKSYE